MLSDGIWTTTEGLPCPVAEAHRPVKRPADRTAADEALMRARNRENAEARELITAIYGPGWHMGTCTRCHTPGTVVSGPPGAQLCSYCTELRAMEPAVTTPAAPVRTAYDRRMATAGFCMLGGWLALVLSIVWPSDVLAVLCVTLFGMSIAIGR